MRGRLEPGLFQQRTRLAWQRTALSGLICLLVIIRLLAEVSVAAALVVAVVAVLALATPTWSAARWRRDQGPGTVDGRRLLALVTVVAVTSLAAAVYAGLE